MSRGIFLFFLEHEFYLLIFLFCELVLQVISRSSLHCLSIVFLMTDELTARKIRTVTE